MALANTKLKTLSKNQKEKNQRPNKKQRVVRPGSINPVATNAQIEQEQQSGYDSYYKQLAEEIESIERHVRELRQTPGLEHLTEEEAYAQVDFMLRFSAWVFNQHLQEQQVQNYETKETQATEVSKVQKPKGTRNKRVTASLSR
ncbi:hypothetical protein ABID22_002233 [Pontibacter aydingkolensis]|uniref:Uncharacterized protein n=1 Tax=Pontibacter aydingkolensis TaxID=1911536 RepID=A0ABS7CVV6_9BACT|nr:hypothetical protein [Pontibacter aydingkolensis]MBW7467836.1 hypothetical protein [Pontibacter aydingkolensis]